MAVGQAVGVSGSLVVYCAFPDAAASMRCSLDGGPRPALSRIRDRVGAGEAGPAKGSVTPASLRGRRCSMGRARVRPVPAPPSARVSRFPSGGESTRAVAAGLGLEDAPRARSGSGRFQAAVSASWVPLWGWEPELSVCASNPGKPSWRRGVAYPGGESQT